MGTVGQLRRVEERLVKDLEEITVSLSTLGKKYGVSRQAIFGFCKRRGIKRPKREHTRKCSICQGLIRIAKKPHSDFISSHAIKKQLGLGQKEFRYHIGILRKKGLISQKFGGLHSGNKTPDDILKEIFPRRLDRRLGSQQIYTRLKQMITSGKLKKGRRLTQGKIAQDFSVSQPTVAIAFSQLKKDGLVICKGRVGSFVV